MRPTQVLSAGSLDDVKLYLGKKPFAFDETFKHKVLMPGFIEAHGHPLIGAITLTRPLLTYLPAAQAYGPDFPGLKTLAEATAKLKEYIAAETDSKQSVLVWGYDSVALGRHLDREFLDAISASQPLFVWDALEHFVYANTAAMGKGGA
jgi:predicted amidohydrolase YtcJ